jgi:hypothetical protein
MAFAGALAGAVPMACPAIAQETGAVIELFTSQGCSSCPPADALLAEYAGRGDILALSFNVDYWDYLGWKDTLASPSHSARQRAYAVARGDGYIYTPQVVIDGLTHAVGSDRAKIDAALAAATGNLTVPVRLTPSADTVTLDIGAATGMPHATVWMVMYDEAVTVEVERGENTGRTLTYNNVVRKLRPVAMWKGRALSIDLPKSEMVQTGAERCAILLQVEDDDGLPGKILGAAAITWGD